MPSTGDHGGRCPGVQLSYCDGGVINVSNVSNRIGKYDVNRMGSQIEARSGLESSDGRSEKYRVVMYTCGEMVCEKRILNSGKVETK